MGSGFSKMKKQAKAMEAQLAQMQEEMAKLEVTGSAGNGLVELTLSGEKALKSVTIKPDCVDPDDIEGLQDLILSAHNDALAKLDDQMGSNPMISGFNPFG